MDSLCECGIEPPGSISHGVSKLSVENKISYTFQYTLLILNNRNFKLKLFVDDRICSYFLVYFWITDLVKYKTRFLTSICNSGEYLGPGGMIMGSGEGSTMRNFLVCTVYLI